MSKMSNNGPGAMKTSEKPKNLKKSIKIIIKDLSKYKIALIASSIFALAGSILTIIGPNQLTKITDTIAEGIMGVIDTDYILKIAIMLFIIYACSFIFSVIQGFITNKVTQKYCEDLRENISNKLNNVPLSYFDKNETGDILSIATNDVDVISQSLNQSLGPFVSSVFLFIGTTIAMFSTNVILTITAILASLIGFSVMGIILSKSQKYFNKQQNELGKLNGHIEEIYSSHNVVKAYNAVDDAGKKFDKFNNQLFDSALKSQFLSGLMMPLMIFIGNFGYTAVTVVGAYLAFEGHITIGVIIAYMVYIRLFTQPLSNIAQTLTSFQSIAAASERIYKILDEVELENEKNKTEKLLVKDCKGNIEFKNVKFGYNKEKIIIDDFSATINSGQKIAIVGPTGAGKTTLVNLLMRFYEISSGDIIIDKHNIKNLTRENIHELFCMVLQDTWLFEGTIIDNVKYNQKNITEKDVKDACEKVGIDHLIKALPNGYNTVLSDAESLSAGEKQLLTIARGMLKKSPFLILDEATSNVDTRTEELVQLAMDKLTEGKTSFIIAHRLSTIKNADIILVLKDGNILEQGSHKNLLAKNGFYADLYNSQFEN